MEMKSKILVVDDDEGMRDLLELVLQREGYEVRSAAAAIDALEMLRRETFHLVVLDIKMPGMDGIEALGRIIGEQRGLPVVIHSASVYQKDNYLSWSAADFVAKTGDVNVLKKSISQILTDGK
jgi:two-component system response regulator (stage 0 sporulation protein F)